MSHLKVLLHLDVTPKAQSIRDKIDKLDLIRIKIFFSMRDTGKRMKQQATNWEKILACHISDRTLASRTHDEFSTVRKQTTQVLKWAKDENRHFTKKDIWMTNKPTKRCPTSLPMREMQIRTTMKYHYTSMRVATI